MKKFVVGNLLMVGVPAVAMIITLGVVAGISKLVFPIKVVTTSLNWY